MLSHRGEVLIYLTPKICDAPYSKWLYYYVKDIHWKFILYALAILTVGSAFHAFQNAFPCKCSLKLFSFTGRKMHRRQSNVYFACAINSIGRALVAITTQQLANIPSFSPRILCLILFNEIRNGMRCFQHTMNVVDRSTWFVCMLKTSNQCPSVIVVIQLKSYRKYLFYQIMEFSFLLDHKRQCDATFSPSKWNFSSQFWWVGL